MIKKLVVINSFGPMGSTLLAGLVEKLGFTNVPLRKLKLHHYLMGELDLNCGVMQSRLEEIIKSHSQPILSGGVSVLDRSSQMRKPLTDFKRVEDRVKEIKTTEFKTIRELYLTCCNIYYDSVIYKDMTIGNHAPIKMTVDIHRFDPVKLYRRYQEEFADVRMIHLHRDFKGWINSLASQAFVHPELINRIRFFPHMRYADYDLYERAVGSMPGLHVQFDEMFDTPIEELAVKIADFTGTPAPDIDWRSESYDLYSKIIPYGKAFVRFDDSVEFLSLDTISYFENLIQTGKIKKTFYQFCAWARYLVDMIRYNLKNKSQGQ